MNRVPPLSGNTGREAIKKETARKKERNTTMKKLFALLLAVAMVACMFCLASCDSGKEPAPVAKGMSWIKTNAKMAVDESDATIADLMTDGCNMGVKSLAKYLNQYKAADQNAKNLTKRLIQQETTLAGQMQAYL